MGNCIKKDSGEEWGGEYWGSPANSPARSLLSGYPISEMSKRENFNVQVAGNKDSGDRNMFSDDRKISSGEKKETKEVKIKISKKQLEELLGMSQMKVQEVLSLLINDGDQGFDSSQNQTFDQRSWRPALQSIPE